MKSQDIHSGQDILAPENQDGRKKKPNNMQKQYPCWQKHGRKVLNGSYDLLVVLIYRHIKKTFPAKHVAGKQVGLDHVKNG